MCGIVGYIGDNSASDVLINGLEKLEYRGYDSCGVAVLNKDKLEICKTTNRIDSLKDKVEHLKDFNIGIGHTRWATHGGVSEINAHPHKDNKNRFIVVHNGIIENYMELKKLLKDNGYEFYSETDTEVIPNLINMNYRGNFLEAVKRTTDMLYGSYALGIISTLEPETLIATKKNSPLVVGIGENENFIASDYSAILKYTKNIAVLENDEFAVLKDKEVKFYDNSLNVIEPKIRHIEVDNDDIGKMGYEHFMLKEINENSITVQKTIDAYMKDGKIKFDIKLSDEELKDVKRINIVACGTAMHAGLNAKNIIEKLCKIPVNVEIASEFRYKNPILFEDDLMIFISQSGETADTLACLELVKEKGIKHISFINVKESTMDRVSDNVIYTKAGIEIAVASTKAYVAQVIALDLFAIYLAEIKHSCNDKELELIKDNIKLIPNKILEVLENDEKYLEYSKKIKDARDVFYLGRGLDYFVALEGSLKLKEISYIHAEASAFGELKHGPIALIEKGTPAIVVCTDKELVEKVVSNIKEIKARGANVLVITTIKDFPKDVYDETFLLPETVSVLTPLLSIIPLQLVAYHVTNLKGLDVDKPRNLAKSVTVE